MIGRIIPHITHFINHKGKTLPGKQRSFPGSSLVLRKSSVYSNPCIWFLKLISSLLAHAHPDKAVEKIDIVLRYSKAIERLKFG